jgi:hypothetical protein
MLAAGGCAALKEAGVRLDSDGAADRELHAFVVDSQYEERRPPNWRTTEKSVLARA